MKLSEYFQQQKSQVLTSQMKGQIFSRIQKEKIIWTEISTKFPSKIFFFASKRIMYASLTAFIFVVVFGGLLLDRSKIVDFWIFSVKQNDTPNGVLADYVAEIVEFSWDYSLVRDGLVVKSENLKMIQDGDVVTLPEWTDLIFNLEDWTQAKIVWPAEFSISKTEKWYQVSLFDGKFFRIYCPECSSDVEIVTPDLSIYQEKDQTLDIHIAKEENGELLVKNDGDKGEEKFKNFEEKVGGLEMGFGDREELEDEYFAIEKELKEKEEIIFPSGLTSIFGKVNLFSILVIIPFSISRESSLLLVAYILIFSFFSASCSIKYECLFISKKFLLFLICL